MKGAGTEEQQKKAWRKFHRWAFYKGRARGVISCRCERCERIDRQGMWLLLAMVVFWVYFLGKLLVEWLLS